MSLFWCWYGIKTVTCRECEFSVFGYLDLVHFCTYKCIYLKLIYTANSLLSVDQNVSQKVAPVGVYCIHSKARYDLNERLHDRVAVYVLNACGPYKVTWLSRELFVYKTNVSASKRWNILCDTCKTMIWNLQLCVAI